MVPSERLLVWNVKDGWEPLCKFLGKPIPNIPIPHENKTGDLNFIEEYFMKSEYGQECFSWFKWNFGIFTFKLIAVGAFVVYQQKTEWKFLKTTFEKFCQNCIREYLNKNHL